MKILHISPHYGGGVFTVVNSWVNNCPFHEHTLSYLNDTPQNKKPGHILFHPEMVKDYDIVVCHVWNHPALWDFIVNTELPPCRLIGWSHMAGNHEPYILFDKLIDYFDDFYYTSEACCKNATYGKVIWSSGNMKRFLEIKPVKSDKFTVGYVGTMDFCKLHPDFIEICKAIDIPDIKFIVVGSGHDLETVKEQARNAGLNMVFTCQVPDTAPYLAEMDVFLYPLSETHFGTCEQVLGEALSTGMPAICLDNAAESIIIKNNVNGFLCKDKFEIAEKIKLIYEKKIIFDSEKIKFLAKKMYSTEKNYRLWDFVLNSVSFLPKRLREWENETGNVFTESLGSKADVFINGSDSEIAEFYKENYYQWRSQSKGSINQYADYFKNNEKMEKWREILCDVQFVNQKTQKN